MNTRRRTILILASLGAAALAACGGDVGGTASPVVAADTTAPTATLVAPANFAAGLSGTVALSVTASDNVGVAGVEFQIDGVTIGAADTTAPFAATLDTGAYASGQHVLRARASDAAGNASPWASATVQFGGGVTQPAGFTRNESWVTGLSSATAFAQAPDGRLFVAEQAAPCAWSRTACCWPRHSHRWRSIRRASAA